jgi:flagellar protein FlaG
MNMQIAKISMDAVSYAKSADNPERFKLIKGTKNEAEAKRPAAAPAAPAPVKAGAAQAQTQTPAEQEAGPDDFIQAVEQANRRYETYDKLLQFSIHEDTKLIMIKIINTKTEEIIAEIPPEKILDMIAQLWEMAGLLVDKRA